MIDRPYYTAGGRLIRSPSVASWASHVSGIRCYLSLRKDTPDGTVASAPKAKPSLPFNDLRLWPVLT
jgi:hypothetical protein